MEAVEAVEAVEAMEAVEAVEAPILMFPPPPTRTDPPSAEGRALFNAAAVEAVILMFPLPTTRTDPPTAEGRVMFMLEVVITLVLGIVDVKCGVRMDVLMSVWEVVGRTTLIGVVIVRGMRRCWLTLEAGGLTVMLGELSWYC